MMSKLFTRISIGCALALCAELAYAQETTELKTDPAAAPSTEEPQADEAIGLNLDLGYASSYVFRGFNLFQNKKQLDQHMLLAPGITWSVFDTGLSLGYWGAYQISGDNISKKIDDGVGSEQDLIINYALTLSDNLALSFGVTGYLYPWADKADAGTEAPFYLEPIMGIAWAGPIDASLKISYMVGLQEEIRSFSYLYINPRIGKTFDLSAQIKLALGMGYGFKLWQDGNDEMSNVHDVAIDIALPISIVGGLYVTPSFHTGWTNIVGSEFADEIFLYGGLNVGVNL